MLGAMMTLADTEHRPYPPPAERPVLAQTWRDLLFMHWPVPPDALRPLIPPALTLDTHGGQAWVGVVPFRMTGIRLGPLPPVPLTDRFPELNVRTYVTDGTRPGVWFFCLDAGNPLGVAVARRWYHLPYFNAAMRVRQVGDTTHYHSRRTDRRGEPARFEATYRPTAGVVSSEPGSIEAFLTERYCLYTADVVGTLYRGEIHHRRWPLQAAEAHVRVNTMAAAHGIALDKPDTPPLLHYSRRLDVACWPIRPVGGRQSAVDSDPARDSRHDEGGDQ